MKLRKIVIPADIKLVDLSTGKPVQKAEKDGTITGEAEPMTFKSFVLGRLIRDPRFAKNSDGEADVQGVYYGYDLWQSLKDAQPGDAIFVEEACHERLVKAIDKPTQPYDVGFFAQVTNFFAAIKDAEKVDVEPKAKAESKPAESAA